MTEPGSNGSPANAQPDAKSMASGENQAPPSLLAPARDLAFILAILAFFAGSEYRYWYFDYLGIPSSQFPIADNLTIAGSYSVFASHGWWILLAFVVISVISLVRQWAQQQLAQTILVYQRVVLVALLLLSFPILEHWAQQTAGDDFSDAVNRSNVPVNPVVLSFSRGSWASHLLSATRNGCVDLLARTSDTLYVLVRQGSYPYWYVAAIPTNEIASSITPLDYYPGGGSYAKSCLSE